MLFYFILCVCLVTFLRCFVGCDFGLFGGFTCYCWCLFVFVFELVFDYLCVVYVGCLVVACVVDAFVYW